MPILYALVARNKHVLAEYTSSHGNFPTVTRVLLSKIPEQDGRMSYVYDSHIFHYLVDDGITFLCMSDEGMKRRITFSFLDEVKRIFRENYQGVERTALAFSLNDSFAPVLRQQIDTFNTNPTADNISKVKSQIDNVKDVMISNIDRVLERGEKIELLVDKTDKLNHQAFKFEKSSKALKNTMLCKKIKTYILIFVVLGLIGFFVAAMFCGMNFKKCKK
mmetsp:Transcript_20044/g.33777  ORF Transcript_20044/g.33777 Transcript_20044/m.33777 type:complete len:219 (-) Transcript_20044:201-857(-)|eukprot:CAMPEP_0114431968 /NCGR_PEP_ID=MMETSP0103-20121206/10899_1 /TAXON_ID=37642 ORGANISM="Paraphysomonas imperforata, Strain PA2" /NCGR_SAMPLE_ID=MMETSP0103 /ASSEMBLY_ACC=CAM_ASM_000201 /LENGTH=218 /DNA_ID=CAMNT_0001601601 /DNA_START=173 /DNA_END=829 /DNA_ORIENTATION=-